MTNKVLHSEKYLQLKACMRENGTKWVYAHRPNAKDIAVVVPIVKKEDGEYVLFLITKRPPIYSENRAKYCLELPAGLVGDINKDEETSDAIKRELEEESGYCADEIKICSRNISSSAGLTSETSTVALAYIDGSKECKKHTDDDGGVICERKLVKKESIFDFIKDFELQGNAIGAQTLSGLFYYFFGK